MVKIYVGLVYDPAEVMVMEEQTVRQAYEAAGKGSLLTGGKKVQLARAGSAPRTVGFDDTLASLGVQEGDELLLTENHKSAR